MAFKMSQHLLHIGNDFLHPIHPFLFLSCYRRKGCNILKLITPVVFQFSTPWFFFWDLSFSMLYSLGLLCFQHGCNFWLSNQLLIILRHLLCKKTKSKNRQNPYSTCLNHKWNFGEIKSSVFPVSIFVPLTHSSVYSSKYWYPFLQEINLSVHF